MLRGIYKPSLALLTDLYQLTMAYAAFRSGAMAREAVFHLSFRKSPFGGGFALAAGLEYALDYLRGLAFSDDDLAYLATLTNPGGGRLFEQDFLDALRAMPLDVDVDAIPEGTVVFPHEPLLRVKGPLIPCLLAETPLLNMVNFQTLVATKAARISLAARGEPVLEFGLRRSQGIDGALTASRAAFVGGCAATSNVLAGRIFGIPVRGTHAHSWVMLFDTELDAFETYARALPANCVFLVDTYDTLEGIDNAIEAGRALRKSGFELLGVRLDSGDLAELSIRARERLDAAGFQQAAIYASNELDERVIQSLKEQGATIAVWGVGTRLVTAHDDPALGGVYKLSAVRERGQKWQYRIKLSDQPQKISTPGILQVRRYFHEGPSGAPGTLLADAVFDEELGMASTSGAALPNFSDAFRRVTVPDGAPFRDLLRPMMRAGELVEELPSLDEIRAHALEELGRLPAGVKRFLNPHEYPVAIEPALLDLKSRMVREARKS